MQFPSSMHDSERPIAARRELVGWICRWTMPNGIEACEFTMRVGGLPERRKNHVWRPVYLIRSETLLDSIQQRQFEITQGGHISQRGYDEVCSRLTSAAMRGVPEAQHAAWQWVAEHQRVATLWVTVDTHGVVSVMESND